MIILINFTLSIKQMISSQGTASQWYQNLSTTPMMILGGFHFNGKTKTLLRILLL